MEYFLGIDGGGSKTRFALCDSRGTLMAEHTAAGSSYRELGVEAVCALLLEGAKQVTREISSGDVAGVCFGMPCYGENKAEDAVAAACIASALSPLPVTFQNDVAAAWAGPLAFQSGIIILAGTGSMALGRDARGEIRRAGGWSEFFSDEGSCYWLGKRALEIFAKQADGRLPRAALYDIMREHFALCDDYDIVGRVESEYQGSRHAVASLQLLLERAALAGDGSAKRLYVEAAEELALMIRGLRSVMELPPMSPLSYAGGLFNAGEMILSPLKAALEGLDMTFIAPLLLPVDGAILFAVEAFRPQAMAQVIAGLRQARG